MNAIKDLTLPSFSFLIGAVFIVFAVVRNVSIKEINVKLNSFQSFLLGILGLVFVGIGIYGYFLYPQASTPGSPATPQPASADTTFVENTKVPTYSSISSDAYLNSLLDGQSLVSTNGQHVLRLKNGVVTLYSNGTAVWQTKTEGSNADRLVIQADGNLVLYAKSQYIWDTSTAVNPPAQSYTLEVQNDGNLLIYDNHGKRNWSLK